jgi:hypothetical protein
MSLTRNVPLTEHEEFVILEALRCATRRYDELARMVRRDLGDQNPAMLRIAEQFDHQAEQARRVVEKLEGL